MAELTGRRALVTGSSRGIGLACARALVERGAAVAIHGRTESEALVAAEHELRLDGGTVVMVHGDLAEQGAPEAIVDHAAEALGGLEILVNNAGFVLPMTAEAMDRRTWQAVIDVNLTGAFFCAQAAARHMRSGGWGRIINVSSVAAEVGIPTYVHYGASKGAMNAMTRYLAMEWAPQGITVNVVAPAFIATDLARDVFAANPALYEDQVGRVLKRRMGTIEEVAAGVCYLASPTADYTTGAVLHVDGGYLAM